MTNFKVFHNFIGNIPYRILFQPSVALEKKHNYLPTNNSPSATLEVWTLDRIWKFGVQTTRPWFKYQGFWPGRKDSQVSVHWTPDEGWWIEGQQTGRRTRPMPRIIAAMLCGLLIWTFPEIMEVTLEHAEKTERYELSYAMLAGVTIAFGGLIMFYMWLGYKSGPSGLEHALRQFSAIFGKDKEEDKKNSNCHEDNTKKSNVENKTLGES